MPGCRSSWPTPGWAKRCSPSWPRETSDPEPSPGCSQYAHRTAWVSQRHACRIVGQHRSTQRQAPPKPAGDAAELRDLLRALFRKRPRWGCRRSSEAARREGWRVNEKRMQRLWREQILKVPHPKRKRPHRAVVSAVGAMCPIAPNAPWALDFQFGTTTDDRTIKPLNIVAEHNPLMPRHCRRPANQRRPDRRHSRSDRTTARVARRRAS